MLSFLWIFRSDFFGEKRRSSHSLICLVLPWLVKGIRQNFSPGDEVANETRFDWSSLKESSSAHPFDSRRRLALPEWRNGMV